MSASLVGSEMCIRDRVEVVMLGPLEIQGMFEGYKATRGDYPRRGMEPTPCLLYTSDAADDM
eukprot:324857-Alexandrium_andersonii.AAC.1